MKEWYREDINKIFSELNTPKDGLTKKRVEENKEKYGLNVLSAGKKRTLKDILWSQINNPLIHVLMFADLLVFLMKDYVDGFIILFIIIFNTIIGVIQEGKAENTLEALKKVIKTYATILRDGAKVRIPDYEIVVGDILVLKDGDPIAADARIIEHNGLKMNESALTGESEPVSKVSNPISSVDVNISDQKNMVFRGTYVYAGLATAIVVNTGIKTAVGKIAKQLVELKMDVPLKKNIHNLSKLIITTISIISVFLFFYGLYVGYAVAEIFMIVVAVAVSSVPEGLPVVVTLVLATGVWRMSQRKVLVKRLQAVEALGQADIIALDKTGTITKNQMAVERIYVNGRFINISGNGYEPKGYATENNNKIDPTKNSDLDLMIKSLVFTSIADIEYSDERKEWELKYGDPTEAALLVLGKKFGYEKEELEQKYPKIIELPFELETKHHTTVNKIDGKKIMSTVGSPEVILDKCTQIFENNESRKINKNDLQKLNDVIKEFSSEGYRILAVGINLNPPKDIKSDNLPNLSFLGFVAIVDAIRPEVEESVQSVKRAGMGVVMITGDHVDTAIAIAKRIGIYEDGNLALSGKELMNMSDDELLKQIDNVTVFARVTPKDKLRIIEIYKKKGHTIAMTGDGVNDALSLVAADLGVAMGKIGTEVAREASDIILLDDKFGNIIEAAEEGRNIYWTIRKAILYLISTSIGEIFVIVTAILLGLPLPLVAAQIIWLNLVTDTFLVSAISVDPKEEGLLNEKFKKPSKYIIDWSMAARALVLSSVMAISTLLIFVQYFEDDLVKATTIALTTLAIFQWFNIFNVRSRKESIFSKKLFNNKYLVGAFFLVVSLQILAVYNPFMQSILKTTGLSLSEWGIMLLIGTSIIFVEEIRKLLFRLYSKKLLFK